MGCVSKRRSDGIWYYMEVKASDEAPKKGPVDKGDDFVPEDESKLPF